MDDYSEDYDQDSDWGSGFLYPLVLFAGHRGEIRPWKADDATRDDLRRCIESAVDHLRGIVWPPQVEGTAVGAAIQEFKTQVDRVTRTARRHADPLTITDFDELFRALGVLMRAVDLQCFGIVDAEAKWG